MSPDVGQRDHLERDRDPTERGPRDGHEKRKKSGHTPQGEHHSSLAATRDPHDGWRGGQLRKTTGHGVRSRGGTTHWANHSRTRRAEHPGPTPKRVGVVICRET